MAAPKPIQVFAAPTEYERQAAEARRRQALAEALEAQAYQPLSGSAAPIPSAAPLVMALQSFLSARQRRKAEEAGEKAKTADIEGMRELVRQLGPQERTGAETAMQQMRDTAMPGQLSAQGTYTPSQITPMSAPIGMPYTQAAPTGQERQNLLLQAQFGGTPRAGELAKALMAVKPETEEFGTTPIKGKGGKYYLASKTGRLVETDVEVPEEEMTPYQAEQLRLEREKLGVEREKARKTDSLTLGDRFKNENTLRDEYVAQTAPFRTVQDAYSKIKSTSDTGAGDMSLLYSYVKLLDPGSVVRESEFATAAASGSFGERVQGAVNQILSGQRLPASLRQAFKEEAEKIYTTQSESAKRIEDQYRGLATSYGLDPSRVIINYAPPKADTKDSVFKPPTPQDPFSTPTFTVPLPNRVNDYYR